MHCHATFEYVERALSVSLSLPLLRGSSSGHGSLPHDFMAFSSSSIPHGMRNAHGMPPASASTPSPRPRLYSTRIVIVVLVSMNRVHQGYGASSARGRVWPLYHGIHLFQTHAREERRRSAVMRPCARDKRLAQLPRDKVDWHYHTMLVRTAGPALLSWRWSALLCWPGRRGKNIYISRVYPSNMIGDCAMADEGERSYPSRVESPVVG